MKNIPDICITETQDAIIRLAEKRSVIRFHNTDRKVYKKVQIDGCAIREGEKCDNMLCSHDGHEEMYIELKGSDIPHAISQLRTTIKKVGEFDGKRCSYIVCTKVAPHTTTQIQKAKIEFKRCYKSDLIVKETPLDVILK